MRYFQALRSPVKFTWKSLLVMGVLSAYLYVFFEWLFIVTKPSFFTSASLIVKLEILLFSGSLFAAICTLFLAALFGAAALVRREKFRSLLLKLGALVPAAVLSALALLMIDNFTYTVLKFGIISTDGFARALYLVGFILLFLVVYSATVKYMAGMEKGKALRRRPAMTLLAMGGWLLVSLALLYRGPEDGARDVEIGSAARGRGLPNIILITADGLDASHTSLYGYERDTTPNLTRLAQSSLLAENVFNNSANTTGSVLSIYTGKYPTTTRTLYSPDILRGKDSYQHLPNILKRLGYYNVQYTQYRHIDAVNQNLLAGFDEINGKIVQQSSIQNKINRYLETDYAFFVYELVNRITDRLRHITFNKKMLTQEELVLGTDLVFEDQMKVDSIMKAFRAAEQPVFAHLHWMGTHGSLFHPSRQIFSRGKNVKEQQKWDGDFYDDSIVDFDAGVKQIVDKLVEMGVYDDTVLIISSDHSENYGTSRRIPLLIHFPGDEYQKRVRGNLQSIDIAPTLLEYLGIPRPSWMQGRSFLTAEPGNRPIFAVGIGRTVSVEKGVIVQQTVSPPFYQFGFVSLVYCDTWYKLDLYSYQWEKGPIAGHSGFCGGAQPVDDETAFLWIRDYFAAEGYDVSSLQTFQPVAKNVP